MSEAKRDLSFWMLADNTRREAMAVTEHHRQVWKVQLKHTLLFNVYRQRLTLTDSQIINNTCLRWLLRNDDDFRELVIGTQMVALAVRQNSMEKARRPDDLVSEFIKSDKYMFDHKKHGEGEELAELWQKVPMIAYSLPVLARRFEQRVLETFLTPAAQEKLGGHLAQKVHDLAQAELKANGELGRIFFYDHIQEHLAPAEWQTHGGAIHEFALAHYVTNLPQLLDADPIYAAEHAKAFELVRGLTRAPRGQLMQHTFSFDGKLGLAGFTKGVELLQSEDILDMLDTDEAEEFGDARHRFNGSDEAIQSLEGALAGYIWKIEERIAERHAEVASLSAEGTKRTVGLDVQAWSGLGNIPLEMLSLTVDHLPSWLKIPLDLAFIERIQHKQVVKAEKAKEREYALQHQVAGKMQRAFEGGARIEPALIVLEEPASNQIETVYR